MSDLVTFNATDLDLRPAPIRPEWIMKGAPVAKNQVIATSADRASMTLMWTCTAGVFKWIYDEDETVYIVDGGVTLTEPDGRVAELKAGDVVFFPAGSQAVWRVDSHVRKIAFFRHPAPRPLWLILRVYRKLRAWARGSAPAMHVSPIGVPALA